MYPVYLLEDDLQQQAIYQQIIANTIMINEFGMTLKCAASDTETLLAAIKDQQRGLFFLDMEIEDNRQAGLEVATKIRQMMPFAQIVFITTHEELTLLTLERKIAPLDYILKDQSMAEIKRQLIDDLLLAEKQNEAAAYHRENLFSYKIGPRFFSLPLKEVVYLYTEKENPGHINLLAVTRKVTFPGNLNALETQYPMLFRCDKSYLVNLSNIANYDSKTRSLSFIDGSEAKVSFRKSRELVAKLKQMM